MKFIEEVLEKFDKDFDWKDCGNFKRRDATIRPCYSCGFDTMFCDNCKFDHHIIPRDQAIKSFITSEFNRLIELAEMELDKEKEDFVCTCERRVCHCGKYPTRKEGEIHNKAISKAQSILKEIL